MLGSQKSLTHRILQLCTFSWDVAFAGGHELIAWRSQLRPTSRLMTRGLRESGTMLATEGRQADSARVLNEAVTINRKTGDPNDLAMVLRRIGSRPEQLTFAIRVVSACRIG